MKLQIIKNKESFYKRKSVKTLGFTLVELIIVITILAILATIAFISFKNYSSNARDWNRISTLKNIETGFELFSIKTWSFPIPESPTIFTGWVNGNIQLQQWFIGENIAKIIQMNSVPLDPKNQSQYIYSTYGSGKYYQIWIESENQVASVLPQTYADSTSMLVKWNYTFTPSLPSLIIWSGSELFSPDTCFLMNGWKNTLKNCKEKKSEMILKNYDSSLLGYFDMETITSDDWVWAYLKDISGNAMNCRSRLWNTLVDGPNGNAIKTSPIVIPVNCIGAIWSTQNKFTITFKYKINSSDSWLFSFWSQLPPAREIIHNIISGNHIINGQGKWYNQFGTRHLYTVLYDEWNYKMYIDKDLIFEQNNVALWIDRGIFLGTTNWVLSDKTVDELIIYNYVLSESEIVQNIRLAGF